MSDSNIISDDKGGKSHTSEPDYQDFLKTEFDKLHREYRKLENKRHAIAQKDGYVHKRTDRLLPMLDKEHVELEYEIKNATCRAYLRRSDGFASSMRESLEIFDLYQLEITKKVKQIIDIEHHVDRITEKVVKQRIKLLGMHGLSKSMAQREKELKRAEDKQYHYQCAFNLQIHENKGLRYEIMDFLRERGRFFKMHNSIKRQIGHAKQKMLNIVQLAIQTYDNRGEAMSKVKALRERETKEAKQHGMEVQEFERTLHHDKSILGFIKTKLKKRPFLEDALDRRIRVGSAKERELDAILKKYHKSFERILKYSKTNSILDLVDRYNGMDLNNFEVFKFITDLNRECEVLREAVELLKTSIETVHVEVEKREREQRQAQEELQFSIIKLQEQLETMQHQLRDNKVANANIFDTIGAAVVISDCNTAPILRLLGNEEGIGVHNVRLCFTQLDIKITEMKCERDRLRDLKSNHAHVFKSAISKPKQHPTQGGPFLPKFIMIHGDNMDDEDSKIFDQEPFYYDEMREYVFQKLIEDHVVDPDERALMVSSYKKGKSTNNAGTTENRKTLVDKARQSQSSSRKRKMHLNDSSADEHDEEHSFPPNLAKSTAISDSISTLAKDAKNILRKDKTSLQKTEASRKTVTLNMEKADDDYNPSEDDTLEFEHEEYQQYE